MKLLSLCFPYAQNKKLFSTLSGVFMRRRRRQRWEDEDEWAQEAFNLDHFSRKECRKYFRFQKSDLERVRLALQLPQIVRTKEEDMVSGIEKLCILLLTYPNKWLELRRICARSQESLSRIFYHVLFLVNRKC